MELDDLAPDQLTAVRRLRNLLDLLPANTEKRWWDELNRTLSAARRGFGSGGYLKENIQLARTQLRDVLDGQTARFGVSDILRQLQYLTLLETEDSRVAECIGRRVIGGAWGGAEHGHRWLDDVNSTTWHLHVSLAPYGGLNGRELPSK